MNNYEIKQENKRKRYLNLAKKFEEQSKARRETADDIMKFIPFGQPILVGHHSEKRHRRDLNRIDNNIRKSIELQEKSEYYKEKAESVGSGGISQDDPEAVQKLKDELTALESSQTWMKNVNRVWRKSGKPAPKNDAKWEEIAKELNCNIADLQTARKNLDPIFCDDKPFPSYTLSNNNNNMKRIKQRIAELQTRNDYKPIEMKGNGFIIFEDREANRIKIHFDEKPEREICRWLRKQGWKYSPTNRAWQRFINNLSRCRAKTAFEHLNNLGAI